MEGKYSDEAFGAKLRGYRAMARMSQDDLAKASGVDKNSIARYEIGGTTPGLDKAVQLASVLGVTLDDLYPMADAD